MNMHRFLLSTLLAFGLPFVAGVVNTTCIVVFNFYSSHLTGHTTQLVNNVMAANPFLVAVTGQTLAAFLVGAIASSWLLDRSMQYHRTWRLHDSLLLEIMLLLLGGSQRWLWCFAMAMGIQNALTSKISKSWLRSTHVTGLWTDIGICLAQGKPPRWRQLAILGGFTSGAALALVLYPNLWQVLVILALLPLVLLLVFERHVGRNFEG